MSHIYKYTECSYYSLKFLKHSTMYSRAIICSINGNTYTGNDNVRNCNTNKKKTLRERELYIIVYYYIVNKQIIISIQMQNKKSNKKK